MVCDQIIIINASSAYFGSIVSPVVLKAACSLLSKMSAAEDDVTSDQQALAIMGFEEEAKYISEAKMAIKSKLKLANTARNAMLVCSTKSQHEALSARLAAINLWAVERSIALHDRWDDLEKGNLSSDVVSTVEDMCADAGAGPSSSDAPKKKYLKRSFD